MQTLLYLWFQDSNVTPFQEVRLSSGEGVTLEDCAWNPTVPELIAVSLSDGMLLTIQLSDKEFTINSIPASTGAKYAFCYSFLYH